MTPAAIAAVPFASLYRKLESLLSGESRFILDEPMARHTTLRVGGPADCYVEPASESDLARLVRFCSDEQLKFCLIGRGSNLVIRDGGIRGVVVCLNQAAFTRLEIHGTSLTCGAGARLKSIAVEARRHSLAGLEFLEGIPGNLGGALRMNAGAMGSCLFDRVQRVRIMDHSGRIEDREAAGIPVQYRRCPLLQNHIALSAVLEAEAGQPETIGRRMAAFSRRRWGSQPAAPSAGCMFKNPPSIPAGQLIDELGLKGTRMGGAVVSEAHGNFLVNEGQATAREVLALIELIQKRALKERGIQLEPEVEILGEDGSD